MRSAVLVQVPEAEPVVGEWRNRYTLDAPAGIPAHVTILARGRATGAHGR